MSSDPTPPKAFISYSWTNPDHEAWVVGFAHELVSQGVHVVLDKWDLQPGHDANAFMESIVTDPSVTKVILICDKKYAEKSDSRAGGAGTEAQIITPDLYARRDQNKFVAVIRERDDEGRPYVPVYYGSRVYIDFTDPSTYGTEFDRLLRWIYDRPLYVRPQMGAQPAFLAPTTIAAKIASSVAFRRVCDAIRGSQPNVLPLLNEYLLIISKGLEGFRIAMHDGDPQTFDDRVIASIDEFRPYRNELIEIFSLVAQYDPQENMMQAIHRFFERILPYMSRPEHINSYNEEDFDNFRFIIGEIYLYAVAILIDNERFSAATYLIESDYYWEDPSSRNENMHPFWDFSQYMQSLERRNARLGLNRLSLRADLLHEHSKSSGVEFRKVMAADFILYLRSQSGQHWSGWYPNTLLYAGRFGGVFELFARAKSLRYFEKIKGLIGVKDKAGFDKMMHDILSAPDRIPKWQFERINPARLAGAQEIATGP